MASQYKEDDRTPNFQDIHDAYLQEWERAMASGDCSKLEALMGEDYYVTFFTRNEVKPVFFNRQEAIDGMRQSIATVEKAEKRFENTVVRLKGEKSAAVFYEQILVKDDVELARLFTIEDWQEENGTWMIAREIQEHIK